MLYEEIKKANIEAMKSKDSVARSIFSVILNKIMLETIKKREKNEALVDGDIVAILQKTVKELKEEQENYKKAGNEDEVKNLEKQLNIVERFMPKLLSSEEIKDIILALPDKSVPAVMKYFKLNYFGKCDMKLVQDVLRTL